MVSRPTLHRKQRTGGTGGGERVQGEAKLLRERVLVKNLEEGPRATPLATRGKTELQGRSGQAGVVKGAVASAKARVMSTAGG